MNLTGYLYYLKNLSESISPSLLKYQNLIAFIKYSSNHYLHSICLLLSLKYHCVRRISIIANFIVRSTSAVLDNITKDSLFVKLSLLWPSKILPDLYLSIKINLSNENIYSDNDNSVSE